jgi:acyl-CoA reductase-like NAD-dependent aldehyde dehydrogenase
MRYAEDMKRAGHPTLASTYPYWLAGRAMAPNSALEVRDKYSGEVATRVAMADPVAIDAAIAAAAAAAEPMRRLAAYERQAVLSHCVRRFEERSEELATSLCIEAGKPIRDSRGEVTRLIDTFRIAAEEAPRLYGEVQPMDVSPRARAYTGIWRRVPIGPCSFISPFNFPLNLAAHKMAPAIAAGCPFVLKPASLTPVGALLIGEVLAETDLPPGAFSVLPCRRDGAELFSTDERLKLLSFTGSPEVGWALKARAGKKKVVLELGGNAAVVVDETGNDLGDVVERVVFGAFYQSGQSCIGVQRILAHDAIYDELRDRLVAATTALVMGDPGDERTFIGPMITEDEAIRLQRWIASAVARGARLLCGGGRTGAMLEATLLEDVPRSEAVVCKEAFGPVAVLSRFHDFDAALAEVNDSVYGLQAGLFTRDLYRAHRAWDVLEVGGVVIGDVPSFRVDHMPYGGIKESGLGREGVRFAMEDMTEIRLLVIRTPPARG